MNASQPLRRFGAFLGALTICVLAAPMATSQAQTTTTYYTTDLSTAPPDLTVAVAPNIAVTFDDSGSMGASNLPDTLDGSTGQYYYYSSNSNSQYYNPNITYTPPLQADGQTPFTTYPYTAAPRDGICATLGTCTANIVNLSTAFRTGFYTITSSGVGANSMGSTVSSVIAGGQSGGFYYDCPIVNSNTNCAIRLMSASTVTDAQRQNFANWYSYYRTRNLMTRSALANVFAGLGTSIRVAFQNLNNTKYWLTPGTTTFDAFSGTARSSFFTWLYQIGSSGGTPSRVAIERAGAIFKYGQGVTGNTNPYWEPNVGPNSAGMELSCRLNYSLLVTDGYWNGDDPGKRSPTARTAVTLPDGTSYSGATNGDAVSKIFWNVPATTYSTLSDLAFYYWATNLRPDFTSGGKPKLDVPPSFTDYTDQNGKPVNWDGTGTPPVSLFFNPKNDPATWPHVVQYMIALGIDGSLDFDGDYAALRAGTKGWPTPTGTGNGDLTDIDDTWHAAVNSRGQYFSARDPDSLAKSLVQLLNRIISRTSSAVAGALSSSVLTGNGVTYLTGFDSSNWSGSLVAALVDANGTIGKQIWSAGDLLTTRAKAGDSRVILTSTSPGKGAGAAFQWTSISTALKAIDGTNFTDANGASKIAYLRGDSSLEGTTYRRRTSTLGAIVNSQSVYVAFPASGYSDTFATGAPESARDAQGNLLYSYEKFANDHAKRAPTVYVGADDGMLHAFDATTDTTPADSVDVTPSPGRERWAYVPYSVYNKLNYLTPVSNFTLVPTVDATPVTRDVFFSTGTKGWHTILVAGLRLGGRGVYALDITDASASEADPGSKVLWEFSNQTVDTNGNKVGANLGYTYGKPNVGRLANGKWVVLVPSGYFPSSNSGEPYKTESANDPAAARKQSSLFVLDAQTGAVIRELVTPTTATGVSGNIVSYGLSSPVLGDYNNDQIDDVAFAGDLNGNLWRFDLSNANPSQWSVSLAFYSSSQGKRPITVMPRLFADPASSYFMVVFGTGKYLGGSDNTIDTSTVTQYVYGIRDRGPGSTAPVIEGSTKMVEQLLTEVGDIRGLTQNAVPAVDANNNPYGGWFIKLFTGSSTNQTNKGERVVVDATALFDSGRAIITTLLPGNTDPCEPVRKGAILVIDAATGGAASGVSVGAANLGAGYVQAGARVNNVPISGSLPAATGVGGGKIALPGLTITDAAGNTSTFNIGDAVWRRRSWRELNNVQ
ncbi:type IV pilus assembly protein PilY1 [Luteibacter sp. W1I16]|uniref:pilus assembly protein n=1 Tax=Luteibacter sp. W1I16 TaxID=3373922 RepID=UPI003D1C6990